MVSVRLLFAPPASPPQLFHLDYRRQLAGVRTIFVAITASTAKSCTEVLVFPSPQIEEEVRRRACSARRPLPPSKWQLPSGSALRVEPIVLAPWEALGAAAIPGAHSRENPSK